MPRGVPNTTTDTTPAAVVMAAPIPAPEPEPAPEPVKMVPVKLLRNDRPWACDDETTTSKHPLTGAPVVTVRSKPFPPENIVGYTRPAKLRKNSAGQMVEVESALFVKGEQMPAKTPGTGFANKIWAGTVIRLPIEEAKAVRKAGIGEYELDD
jgi:hypothetical protein